MPFGSLFKKPASPEEYPVLLCGLDNAEKSLLWQHWQNTYGLGKGIGPGNPRVALLDTPGAGKIKLYLVNGNGADIPTLSMQGQLQLTGGQASLLFVHNINQENVEDSVLCLHRHISLLYEHGGRGVWVMIHDPSADTTAGRPKDDQRARALVSRFEFEISKCCHDFNWRVVNEESRVFSVPGSEVAERLRTVAEDLRNSPPRDPRTSCSTETGNYDIVFPNFKARMIKRDYCVGCERPLEWWNRFLTGFIPFWTHNDYLRAIFLTILQDENRERGVLEVATDFANKMNSFKQRPVQFPQSPESRTITVFWVYHVKLALDSLNQHFQEEGQIVPPPATLAWSHFELMLTHMPELLIQDLPKSYYSSDVLSSRLAQEYWIIPNLHGLTELPIKHEPGLGRQIILQQQGDPDRLLRFAFVVVQRYLRRDSPRRYSWFIHEGFACLQQNTIRLRTLEPGLNIPAFSMTQAHFFLQMVHLALLQIPKPPEGSKETPLHQSITYPAFKALFHLTPTIWTQYYLHKTWYSMLGRAALAPADLQPLPWGADPPDSPLFVPPNARFHHAGLIAEIPPLEVLNFHVSILLSDAQSLLTPILPSSITTHSALLCYIHTHLLLPGPSNVTPATITRHLDLLATHSRYTRPQASFWIAQCLRAARSTHLPHRATPYSVAFKPGFADPQTGVWRRFHNCPCHADVEMETLLPGGIGPNPVEYPHNYPYEHPPQRTHQCRCHYGQELDHDAFARVCGEGYEAREEMDKQMGGMAARPATLSKDPWENFVRFNPVLAWEGLWGVYFSEEGWERGIPDRRAWEGWEKEWQEGGDGEKPMGEEKPRGEEKPSEADIADQVVRLSMAETLRGEKEDDGKEEYSSMDADKEDAGKEELGEKTDDDKGDDDREDDGKEQDKEKRDKHKAGGADGRETDDDDEWEVVA